MKITYAGNTINDKGENPKDLSFQTSRLSQKEFIINAQNPQIFDKGNSYLNITFTIEKAHKSEYDAQLFTTLHASKISINSPETLTFNIDKINTNIEFENTILTKVKIDTQDLFSYTKYEFLTLKPKDNL